MVMYSLKGPLPTVSAAIRHVYVQNGWRCSRVTCVVFEYTVKSRPVSTSWTAIVQPRMTPFVSAKGRACQERLRESCVAPKTTSDEGETEGAAEHQNQWSKNQKFRLNVLLTFFLSLHSKYTAENSLCNGESSYPAVIVIMGVEGTHKDIPIKGKECPRLFCLSFSYFHNIFLNDSIDVNWRRRGPCQSY